jgi:hypothetical protein
VGGRIDTQTAWRSHKLISIILKKIRYIFVENVLKIIDNLKSPKMPIYAEHNTVRSPDEETAF